MEGLLFWRKVSSDSARLIKVHVPFRFLWISMWIAEPTLLFPLSKDKEEHMLLCEVGPCNDWEPGGSSDMWFRSLARPLKPLTSAFYQEMYKQILQCIPTRRSQPAHFLKCNQMSRASVNWDILPAKWPTSTAPLSQLHSTLEAFNVQGNPCFFFFKVNKGVWTLLYLTWRVESTLRGPVAVPELFPCGATGPFNTRQIQCGLIRKLGSCLHHGQNDGLRQSLSYSSDTEHQLLNDCRNCWAVRISLLCICHFCSPCCTKQTCFFIFLHYQTLSDYFWGVALKPSC